MRARWYIYVLDGEGRLKEVKDRWGETLFYGGFDSEEEALSEWDRVSEIYNVYKDKIVILKEWKT